MEFVFIGGMGRSGTSLLRAILDSHSKIAAGPEFDPLHELLQSYRSTKAKIRNQRIASYISFEEARSVFKYSVTSLLGRYAHDRKKRILVEKTPSNIWYFEELFELFPDAKFIQMLRDGRDVVCSHLEVGRRFQARGLTLDPTVNSALMNCHYCSRLWAATIQRGLELSQPSSLFSLKQNLHTVRYEDLVLKPERTIRHLCDFLEVAFEPQLLNPHENDHTVVVDDLWVTKDQYELPIHASRLRRWRKDLSLRERIQISIGAEKELGLLGYASGNEWIWSGFGCSKEECIEKIEEVRREVTQHAEADNRSLDLAKLQ